MMKLMMNNVHHLLINERRRCELDNIVGSMAIVEKIYERSKR